MAFDGLARFDSRLRTFVAVAVVLAGRSATGEPAHAQSEKAHVRLAAPGVDPEVSVLRIYFDHGPVDIDRLGEELTVDPGRHHVSARAVLHAGTDLRPLGFERDYDVKPAETVVVQILLQPTGGGIGVLECAMASRTRAEGDEYAFTSEQQKELVIRAPSSRGCACGEATRGGAAAARGLLAPALLFVSAVACGGAKDPGAAARDASDWVTRFLELPPQATITMRIAPYAPAWWGPRGPRSPEDGGRLSSVFGSPGAFALASCEQVDGYVVQARAPLADAEVVLVLHHVPPWLDPVRPYPDVGTRPAAWFERQLSSGVRAYRSEAARGTARLFVLPSSTWVVSTGVPGERLAQAFASSADEPPYLPIAPGGMIQAEVQRGTPYYGELVSTILGDERRATLLGLVGAGVVVYAPAPQGGPAGVTFKLAFPDAAAAAKIAPDLARAAMDTPYEDLKVTGAQASGAAIFVTAYTTLRISHGLCRELRMC